MSTDLIPTRSRKRRFAPAIAAVAVAGMVAPAALAAIWSDGAATTNFAVSSCLTLVSGADTTISSATIPNTGAAAAANYGVHFSILDGAVGTGADGTMTHKASVRIVAPEDFITYSTAAVKVQNNCAQPMLVNVKALSATGFAKSGLSLYLSEKAAPGTDFTVAADWGTSHIKIQKGSTIASATAGGATTIVAAGSTASIGLRTAGETGAGVQGTAVLQMTYTPQ